MRIFSKIKIYLIHNLGPTKTTTPNWTPGSIVKITTKTVTEMGKDDHIELRICGSKSCPDPKYDIFQTFPACPVHLIFEVF